MISSDVLQALYGTSKTLIVSGDGYRIELNGRDIKNVQNELRTEIQFSNSIGQRDFVLNDGKHMPGKVLIVLEDRNSTYKWLYLYNSSLKKWQFLNSYQNGTFSIDTEGHYCLRQWKIASSTIKWLTVAACSVALAIGSGAYVIIKKKYWFW